jgi:hypothetical protein
MTAGVLTAGMCHGARLDYLMVQAMPERQVDADGAPITASLPLLLLSRLALMARGLLLCARLVRLLCSCWISTRLCVLQLQASGMQLVRHVWAYEAQVQAQAWPLGSQQQEGIAVGQLTAGACSVGAQDSCEVASRNMASWHHALTAAWCGDTKA